MDDFKQASDIDLFSVKITGMESVAERDKETDLGEHSDGERNPGQRARPFQKGK